jgi:mono/diheme cytochrome c family protein
MLLSPKSFCALVGVLVALSAAGNSVGWSQTQVPRKKELKPAAMPGKQIFASTCANCHGLDGRGGERAPNIAENGKAQRLSDDQIAHIIENGIPGTGMPAFHSLDSSNIKAVVTYLRTLQGTKQPVKLPGDAGRGETIFFGKTGCAACHMAAGKGGFIASDLSTLARIRWSKFEPRLPAQRQAAIIRREWQPRPSATAKHTQAESATKIISLCNCRPWTEPFISSRGQRSNSWYTPPRLQWLPATALLSALVN